MTILLRRIAPRAFSAKTPFTGVPDLSQKDRLKDFRQKILSFLKDDI
ncbi:MAG: hypothetical protein HZT43_01240 [Exiguobacterium profundum]|nr:MAG: hypothetical protein HZT43_01240 [Exiguobacterium profundum]